MQSFIYEFVVVYEFPSNIFARLRRHVYRPWGPFLESNKVFSHP